MSSTPSRAVTAQQYTQHLSAVLLPALQVVREAITRTEADVAEYQDIVDRLTTLANAGNGRPVETMTELGTGIWFDAQIPDTSLVTLDIGLDLHLELPIAEAIEYSGKRIRVLQKRLATDRGKEENLAWQIEQFRGALSEVNQRAASRESTISS